MSQGIIEVNEGITEQKWTDTQQKKYMTAE